MDREQIAEVVSTALILGVLAFFVVPRAGYEALPERVAASAAAAVVLGVPIALYMVLVHGGRESHFFGPWGPEDLVFLAAALPLLAGTLWVAENWALSGVLYWVAVAVGVVLSVAVGVVVRDATVGEWPPGSDVRREREHGGPPGDR